MVRSSRGKRLPWRDPDYNDTSDSEEDEVSIPASAASPASATAPASGVIAATSSAQTSGGLVIQATSSRPSTAAAGRYFH